jgi:hypothetical protein
LVVFLAVVFFAVLFAVVFLAVVFLRLVFLGAASDAWLASEAAADVGFPPVVSFRTRRRVCLAVCASSPGSGRSSGRPTTTEM